MAFLTRWQRPRDLGTSVRRWNPERLMREMFAWDPFAEIEPMLPPWSREEVFSPDIELKETKDGYTFSADLPGIKQEDVDINVSGRTLTISGKREQEREEKGERYYACEREYGSFTRSFTLPGGADVEHVRAELKDGVLTIQVPKEAAVQPKKISIHAGAEEGKETKKVEAKKAA
jgi:HSP20 family protein